HGWGRKASGRPQRALRAYQGRRLWFATRQVGADFRGLVSSFFDWKASHWQNPFHSLPGRITFFVFSATLLTSLAVTAISVESMNRFLRHKIDQRVPSILARASARLDRWYDQRVSDIGVLARSEIVVRNLGRVNAAKATPTSRKARSEIELYLGYVMESFPYYQTIVVLDRQGASLLSVGEALDLPESLRTTISAVGADTVSDALPLDGRHIQLASARVEDRSGRSLGSIHAVLDLGTLDVMLINPELGIFGRTFIVGADGRILSDTLGQSHGKRFGRALPLPNEILASVDYENELGAHVVGNAQHFSRFGWTLGVEQPYDEVFAPVISGIWRTLALELAIVLLFGLGAFWIAATIVKPIEALSDAARRTSEGEKGVVVPESRLRDEVALLIRTFNQMSLRLASNARELEARYDEVNRMNEVLAQLSITDGLTRLHNHRFFQDILIREAKRADRTNEPLTLILLDIDHFKMWNDRFGHAAGDEILRQLADILNGLVRETDLLARYGGEEFALLAPSTDLEGAIRLAEKMRATVGDTHFVIDPPLENERVTVSIGVAAYRGDRKALFNEADRALYRAKSSGRDCVMTGFEEGETRV
ncbi:MAG: diguanylate cyclase, partial [Myxococcota bacterium]